MSSKKFNHGDQLLVTKITMRRKHYIILALALVIAMTVCLFGAIFGDFFLCMKICLGFASAILLLKTLAVFRRSHLAAAVISSFSTCQRPRGSLPYSRRNGR